MFKSLRDNVIQTIIAMVVTALVIGILGFLKHVLLYQIATAIIITLCFVPLGINQWHVLVKNRGRKNLERFITNLLYEAGINIKKEITENNSYNFILVGSMSMEGREEKITIIQTAKNPGTLIFSTGLQIQKEEEAITDQVTSNVKSTALEDIKIEFAKFGIAWNRMDHPLRSFEIFTIIPCSQLQESDVWEAVEKIRRARVVFEGIMRKNAKLLGLQPPKFTKLGIQT